MDLLVLADQNGVVDMTHEAIARRTNVPIKIVRAAIKELESADPRSRSSDHEGMRLKRLDAHRDWGWMIVNYQKYRSIANAEAYREVNREKVQAIRERAKSPPVPPKVHAHAEVEAGNAIHVITRNYQFKKPEQNELALYAKEIELPVPEISKFYDYYESNGWKVGRNPMKSWQSAMRNWKRNIKTYGKTHQPNSLPTPKRNIGVIDNNTDYAAAGKAKLARQASQVARPMAPTPGVPPHGK